MEAKKNPKQDLQRQSFKFFLIGLSISVALTITAFEWRTKKSKPVPLTSDTPSEAIFQIKATVLEIIPPAPIPIKETITTSKSVVLVTTTVTNDPAKDIDLVIPPDINIDFPGLPVLDEPSKEIFIFVEEMPKPVGGYESFYKELSKTIKYPRQAQRNHTEGKVFVEFIIDQQGNATNLKITKGIGDGCDEEAMRVLLQTRWQPGKQRGIPVKVRLTLPLTFKLN
jgi:protein TonB